MKTIKQHRKEYLDSKVKFYSEDVSRRAAKEFGGCMYLIEDGRTCAIGMDFKKSDKNYEKATKFDGSVTLLLESYPTILPKKIIKLGIDFLNNIQHLHDFKYFWHDKGLTEIGEKEYDRIIEKFCS